MSQILRALLAAHLVVAHSGSIRSCFTSWLEAAPPSATFGSQGDLKCQSRLGCGRLRENAGRDPRPPSCTGSTKNRAKRRALQRRWSEPSRATLAARPSAKRLLVGAKSCHRSAQRHLFRHRERPDTAHESRFGGPMLDKADHYIGPCRCVLDRGYSRSRVEKLHHRPQSKCVCFLAQMRAPSNVRQQSDRERDGTLLISIGKCIRRRAITLCAEPEPRQPPCSAHRLTPTSIAVARSLLPGHPLSLTAKGRPLRHPLRSDFAWWVQQETWTCGPLIKSLRFAISSRSVCAIAYSHFNDLERIMFPAVAESFRIGGAPR